MESQPGKERAEVGSLGLPRAPWGRYRSAGGRAGRWEWRDDWLRCLSCGYTYLIGLPPPPAAQEISPFSCSIMLMLPCTTVQKIALHVYHGRLRTPLVGRNERTARIFCFIGLNRPVPAPGGAVSPRRGRGQRRGLLQAAADRAATGFGLRPSIRRCGGLGLSVRCV